MTVSPAIRSIQRGTQSLNNTTTTYNISISAIVVANTRPFGGTFGGGGSSVQFRQSALATTTVSFVRTGNSAQVHSFPWTVIERY